MDIYLAFVAPQSFAVEIELEKTTLPTSQELLQRLASAKRVHDQLCATVHVLEEEYSTPLNGSGAVNWSLPYGTASQLHGFGSCLAGHVVVLLVTTV